MKLRNILFAFGVMLILAGIGLTASLLDQSAALDKPTLLTAARASVMAAAKAISAGKPVSAVNIKWRELDAGELRPGNILRGEMAETGFEGAISRRDFAAGEALVASDFVLPGDRRFLASVLRPGMRAVSIAVDGSQSASGLALPGDFVDVVLTQSLPNGESDLPRKTVGETVLRNVRLIAVDQTLSAAAKAAVKDDSLINHDGRMPKAVTLEIDERQVETLFVAAQLGKLQLSLRPLETAEDREPGTHDSGPTWASDVSPALKQFQSKSLPATPLPASAASSIESSVRRPPPTS